MSGSVAARAPRTLVMGILNVTPDSFSDGGRWDDTDAAIAHGLDLVDQGADLVDVGGESTRPGAARVDLTVELDRVLPVVRALAEAGVVVSVDTMRAAVAEAAIGAGASIVNDVSGGLADPRMLSVVADAGVDYVAMHWRAHSDTMAAAARYGDVVAEVLSELGARRDAALAAGIDGDRLVLDPGLGFAKDAEHNWALLRSLPALGGLGHRLLIGASRKRFLGTLLADPRTGAERAPIGRDAASAAITLHSAMAGVWCVRTHAVGEHRDAVAVATRLRPLG